MAGLRGAGNSLLGREFLVRHDLFGHPVDPQYGLPGRPRHLPTDATRQAVRAMRAQGLGQEPIAQALGITSKTLRLNYPEELGSTSQTWRRRAQLSEEAHD